MELIVICHNIRSRENTGSIFRTSDAFGIAKIFLAGYTPRPPHPRISKTALGAENYVPWEGAGSALRLIKKLRREGVFIMALEQSKKSITPAVARARTAKKRTALIIGNELKGVPPSLLKHCDAVVEIPMRGALIRDKHHPRHKKILGKESLNVSIAFGIAAYELSPLRR